MGKEQIESSQAEKGLRRRVLVVDDDEDFAEGLAEVLELSGYAVSRARNSEEALRLAGEIEIHVALVDVRLGHANGIKLLDQLKQARPSILCIVVTAYSEIDTAIGALQKGAYDYLSKPLKQDQLFSTLQRGFERVALEEERAIAERALRESESRFRLLAENSQDFIFRYQLLPEEKFEYASPSCEAITGYTPAEFYADPHLVNKVVHPDDQNVLLEFRRFQSPHLFRLIRKDGKTIWVEHKSRLFFNDADQLESMEGIVRDVTEKKSAEDDRRRLEAQILQRQKLDSLGALAGGFAHDFNNILMGILGCASLGRSSVAKDSEARENFEQIEAASKRAAKLIDQMLAYAGKGKFVVEPVDLGELIRDMSQLIRITVSKKIELDMKVEGSKPLMLEGDIGQIRQIVLNLLINASEAIGENSGRIRVRAGARDVDQAFLEKSFFHEDAAEGRYVFIEMADTGCGMDEETLHRIFDPFFSTKFPGRGLGLAALLGIARAHGAIITVQSQPDKGSTFTVLMPAASPDLAAKPPVVGDKEPAAGTGAILVIDDEEIVLGIAQRMLVSLGYASLTARGGEEGVRVFEEHADRIALTLLDLTMPGMSGGMVFDRIREIDPDAPILISSGFVDEESHLRFSAEKNCGIIAKPFELNALGEIIKRILDDSQD